MLTQTESRLTNALQNLLHAARLGEMIPVHLIDAGEDALACHACHGGAMPPPDGGPCCECGAAAGPARGVNPCSGCGREFNYGGYVDGRNWVCNACHDATPAREPVQTPDGWRCKGCGSVLDACGCVPF